MVPPATPTPAGDDPPGLLTPALLEELESIPEPALIILPGGRIAAVNPVLARGPGADAVGMTVGEFIGRFGARRADGRPLDAADFPYTRALRGEHVVRGEFFDGVLPDGTVYHALATSTPIEVDGRVVAALSVWYNFPRQLQKMAGRLKRPAGESAIKKG